MSEIYRKWGCVVRYEDGLTIRVEEAGQATEDGALFRAVPIESNLASPITLSVADLDSFVAQTLLAVRPCAVERLIVSAGIARHETQGVSWTEESRRVHLSVIRPPLRVLIDLAAFDVEAVRAIAAALAQSGDAREPPPRLRLAPGVAAALLPSLLGELALEQCGGGFDGKGQAIETRAVTNGAPPNWYRPSYAIRPRRAWLNVRALPFGAIDRSVPRAVALLAPPHGKTLRVLCSDGDVIYPTTLHWTHVAAVSPDGPVWYPYEAGSFGVEMML